MPQISIIVPCYNQAQYLAETLDSVLAQTFLDWECVIVNDGSPDNTEQIAKLYCDKDSRFVYVFQQNAGLATARNSGINHSSGKYILPLDSDDKIGTTYIEKALHYFNDNPQTKLVYCKACRFGDIDEPWYLAPYSFDQLIWQNCIFCSAIYKRVDYERTIGYNPNMKNGWEDWDFWLSLLDAKSEVHQLDEVLFYYRYHGSSMISSAMDYKEKMWVQIYRNHEELYKDQIEKIVFLHNEASTFRAQYESTHSQLIRLQSSKAYRIGGFLIKPFKWIKNLCKIG